MTNMEKIEQALNALAWHLRVAGEAGGPLCPDVVRQGIGDAKLAFDRLDDGGYGESVIRWTRCKACGRQYEDGQPCTIHRCPNYEPVPQMGEQTE